MRIRGVLASLAIGFSLSAFNASAYGCYGWGFGWPLLSFGLGLGCGFGTGLAVGASWNYPAYSYSYPVYAYNYPVYTTRVYTPPVYVQNPVPATAPAASVATSAPAPQVQQAWIPSSPGAGGWVQDPTPYRYTPDNPSSLAKASPPPSQSVAITRSVGGVPLYVVTR